MVKKMFIQIRLDVNLTTYAFIKGHLKFTKICMVKFNVLTLTLIKL